MALHCYGDNYIELIRHHNDAPAIQTEWLAEGREELRHFRVLVDNIDNAHRRVAEKASLVLQEGAPSAKTGVVIYVNTGGGTVTVTVTEYLQTGEPGRKGFAIMRNARRMWDGTDSICSL